MGVVYEAEDTRLGRHVAMKFLPPSLHGVAPKRSSASSAKRGSRRRSTIRTSARSTTSASTTAGTSSSMELLEGESLRGRIPGQPAAARADSRHRLPDRRRARRGARERHHPSRHQAREHLHHEARPGEAARFRHRQARGDRQSPTRRRKRGRERRPDVARHGGRLDQLHVARAGARRGARRAHRSVFARRRALRDVRPAAQAFAGQTTAVVFDAILNRQPADPRLLRPELPEDLQRVIPRALEKDRRLRFQTAADMLAELGASVATRRPEPSAPHGRDGRPRRHGVG